MKVADRPHSSAPAHSPAKRGRRQGPTRTREAVLDAARRCFGKLGYEKATLRRIAAKAGVDPALVLQFFTSKEQLFRTAVRLPPAPSALQVAGLTDTSRDLGSRVLHAYLHLWESPDAGDTLTALLVSAGTRPDALQAIRHHLRDYTIQPVAAEIGPDAQQTRIALTTSQLVGIAYVRYVMRTGPLAETSVDRLVELIAPIINHYLTGDLSGQDVPAMNPAYNEKSVGS